MNVLGATVSGEDGPHEQREGRTPRLSASFMRRDSPSYVGGRVCLPFPNHFLTKGRIFMFLRGYITSISFNFQLSPIQFSWQWWACIFSRSNTFETATNWRQYKWCVKNRKINVWKVCTPRNTFRLLLVLYRIANRNIYYFCQCQKCPL
jgi:hypothetical protein